MDLFNRKKVKELEQKILKLEQMLDDKDNVICELNKLQQEIKEKIKNFCLPILNKSILEQVQCEAHQKICAL